jgi:signal transduction histidine kinase
MDAIGATPRGDASPRPGGSQPWWAVIGGRVVEMLRDPVGAFRRTCALRGFDYSPATIFIADSAAVLAGIGAAILRTSYFPSVLPILAILVLIVIYPLLFVFDLEPKPIVIGFSALLATALFKLQPVYPDCSSLVLTVMAGEVAAITSIRVSIFYAAAGIIEVLIFGAVNEQRDPGMPIYVATILLGWMVGLMLKFQRRALYQERENQSIRAAQAADEERRRIAREVHDVIAHSLSITLLHLTAARHCLQTDRDVDEAVDALVDAERLGRQAMADIRHTVGLLDRRPASRTPEPGLGDIEDLVADFVGAGLAVDYELHGDPEAIAASISATTGLALYRISQESLSNIAKHAPDATAALRIAVGAVEATVHVTNTFPGGPAPRRGRGMGISGMRQRASALGGTLIAGPHTDGWQVQARIPIDTRGSEPSCPVIQQDPLRPAREALTAVTRKLQEGT